MNLFYWRSAEGNFGDDLNEWLWDNLLPGWRDWSPEVTLVGVGTIFNEGHFPKNREGRFLVLGSGVGYGGPPPRSSEPRFDIRAVRGPRSASFLGLPDTVGIVDPAVMIPTLEEFRNIRSVNRPIFVPHVSSARRHPWDKICSAAGIDYVAPTGESRDVIRKIATSSLVIAESMHAAIIADAFRIPWRAVSLSEMFNADKWRDWGDSLQVTPDVRPLLPAVEWLVRTMRLGTRPKKRARHTSVSSGGAGAQKSWKRQLRLAVERQLIARALRAQLALKPQMSQSEVLEAQRTRYRTMLQGVIRDYGGHEV